MQSLTMFTWGYWGWGSGTEQLVQSIDAVEKSRGFKAPIFVDIRLRRTGRAPGFVGDAFKKAVGATRYFWIEDLGNLGILQGGGIKIKDPAAAEQLLDLAISSASAKRRIIFFCACPYPGNAKNIGCHRRTVAGFVLTEARRRRISTQIIEWPGGEPNLNGPEIKVPDKVFKGLLANRETIPLHKGFSFAQMAGLPWGSVVTVHPEKSSKADSVKLMVGPALFTKDEWYLPIMGGIDSSDSPKALLKKIQDMRQDFGLERRVK